MNRGLYVSPSRLQKRIARSLMVSWREQPTRYDIEALQANIRRVGMVVRVRWILIAVLVIYSIVGAALYLIDDRIGLDRLVELMTIPALALGMVVLYNTFYALNYRRLGNISVWNNLQLFLDSVVVTVLVYYSGGASSWFWTMYSLFILEATFILPRSRDAWLQALTCVVLLGSVEWLEYAGILPHAIIPFASPELHSDTIYLLIRFLWQVAVLVGTAWVANALVGEFRRSFSARTSQQIVDESTGLYSRPFFLRALSAEVHRAARADRPLHVMLVDIDNFGEFNSRFGFDAGDRLIKRLADEIAHEVGGAGDASVSANIVARFGGEEFVVLFAEDGRLEEAPSEGDAARLAEQIRFAASTTRVDGAGVTVSIGLASVPADGRTADEILDAADHALACATNVGNKVVTARECELAEGADE